MKRIPRRIRLPECRDDPTHEGKHDFKTERRNRRAFKILGKREKWLWKHGHKRCWYCGVWFNFKEQARVAKIRKRLMKKWGKTKFKKRDKKQNG